MFALLRPAMQCTESTSLPKYRINVHNIEPDKDKKGDQFVKEAIRYPVLS